MSLTTARKELNWLTFAKTSHNANILYLSIAETDSLYLHKTTQALITIGLEIGSGMLTRPIN